MTLRLSCVSFLNALPFVEGLRRLPEAERPILELDPPFRCSERLRDGQVDAALVPSVEFAAMEGAMEAGSLGIASEREVRSVVLLSRRPLHSVGEVAVDANSRTSVALLGLIFARRFGIRPAMKPMAPEAGAMLARCDAALLIGDAALRASRGGLLVLDLAKAWHGITGLPFVFALWAARTADLAGDAARLLERALPLGLEALRDDPPHQAVAGSGLPADELRDYFTRNIHYRLGVRERESLALFFRMCREEGILAGTVPA
jgi:chorismate dehydratase